MKAAMKNTLNIDEIEPQERRRLELILAFFARGKQIVADNLVENLFKHFNSPEVRVFLSRQLFEEAHHNQFYLNLLDSCLPDLGKQAEVLSLADNIPSIRKKIQFCLKWSNSIKELRDLKNQEDRRKFVLNLICFSTCINGLFFSGAFTYICFLHSKSFLPGLAAITQRILRDETMHMNFYMEAIETIRKEDASLFTEHLNELVVQMIEDAIECEMGFAEDLFEQEILGLSLRDMRQYLEFVADQRLESLDMPPRYNVKNPISELLSFDGAL